MLFWTRVSDCAAWRRRRVGVVADGLLILISDEW